MSEEELNAKFERLINALESSERISRRERRQSNNSQDSNISGTGTSVDINLEKAFDGIGEKVSKVIENIKEGIEEIGKSVSGFADDMFDFYKKLDDARANFAKQTGLFQQAAPIYANLSGKLRGLGMDYSEVATHLSSLIKQIPNFISLSREEQNQIGMQSAALSRLGVDVDTYSQILNKLISVQGLSEEQSRKSIDSLVRFSNALGRPPSIILKDYSSSMSKLALFGSSMKKVFTDSEVLASKLGVTIDKVLGAMDSYNNFEEAAEAAGNLNVLLGQNLFDAQQLYLLEDPSERLKQLAKALQTVEKEQGISFENMSMKRKKELAKQTKMDVELLSQLSKTNLNELAELQKRTSIASDGSMNYQKNVKATISLTERLSALKDRILSAFMPLMKYFEPILKGAAEIAGMFVKAIGKLSEQFPGFTKLLTGLVSAFAAYKALSAAGILGEGGILGKFTGMLTNFIPFGKQLSSLILPGIGLAFAGIASQGKQALTGLADQKLFGEKTLRSLFGLTDANIDQIYKQIEGIKNFIKNSFDNLLASFGVQEDDRKNIISSISNTFSEMYNVLNGVFKKILNIGGEFVLGFSESMQSQKNDDTGPFAKFVIAITDGLKRASVELTESFKEDNKENPLRKAFDQLLETFNKITDEVSKILGKSFGGIFDFFSPKNGEESFMDKAVKGLKNIINNIGLVINPEKVLETIGSIFSGLGGMFTGAIELMKTDFNPDALADKISGIFGAIIGAFSSDVTGDTQNPIGNVKEELENAKDALSSLGLFGKGFKEIASSISSLGDKPGEKIKSVFENFPKFEPVKAETINSIKELANSLNSLNITLKNFNDVKDVMNAIDIKSDSPKNISLMAESIKEYSEALKTLSGVRAEQSELTEALKTLGDIFANVNLTLDAETLGEKMGDKVANAINRRL